MNAEIISVGTELLLGQIVDTNAAYMAAELAAQGVFVYRKTAVGDNEARLTAVIREALGRADVILLTGGLGPTPDDLTREAIAAALGEELVYHEDLAQGLRDFFAARGRTPAAMNFRQATLPASGRALPNPVGTAPGVFVEKDGRLIFALPGVPHEMKRMLQDQVLPILRSRGAGDSFLRSRVVRIFGLGESDVAARVEDLLAQDNPTLAPLAKRGEVQLRITARAASEAEAEALLDGLEATLRERLGTYIFGLDDWGLEQEVGRLLTAAGRTMAVAESCTGGLLGSRLTDVPGSSNYFVGGLIAYSNEVKVTCLGVPEEVLQRAGAVSAETARAMAQGVRHRLGADLGLATTGIAGPTGGTPDKPVGLVYLAVADEAGVQDQRYHWPGPREEVKYRASQAALDLVRRRLLERKA